MESLKQLVKEFKDKGYPNPLIHAEAKLWALQKQALAKQQSPPKRGIYGKPANIKDFPLSLQDFIRAYKKSGGYITQLPEKQSRKSNKKVAVPQHPLVRYRSGHKLTAIEALELLMARGVA